MAKVKHFFKKFLKTILILAAIVLFIVLFVHVNLKWKILLTLGAAFVYGYATAWLKRR